jgi:cytidyltransferase-like protein
MTARGPDSSGRQRARRVYNGGTYDLMHVGHLYVLRAARELAGPDGEVVIALNTDEFVEAFKGHRPVQAYLERSELLAACRYVDRVVPNVGGADSRPALEAVCPDVILAGADWYSEDDSRYCHQMGFDLAWLAERGIELAYLPRLVPGRSSSNLRALARAIA